MMAVKIMNNIEDIENVHPIARIFLDRIFSITVIILFVKQRHKYLYIATINLVRITCRIQQYLPDTYTINLFKPCDLEL